ncbi:MAG: ATP-dependent DNA helicase RecG [Patescibacteria group bacterium]|nr:ATP-dependent DNA helicase RecG [Patescibacteria group bacterium]
MQKINLRTKLNNLRKFDLKHKRALDRLELKNVEDLFLYFPVRYEDFSNITLIKNLKINEKQTIRGMIKSIKNKRTSKRWLVLTEAKVEDESGQLKIVWFNQPYLEKFLRVGTYVTLNGKVELNYNSVSMNSPAFEKFKFDSKCGQILPVYSETNGMSSKYLRFILKPLLKLSTKFEDFMPDEIKNQLSLIDLSEALRQIHFPDNLEILKKARLRLAFDELFLLQLNNLLKKKKWQENKAFKIKFDEKLIKKFVASLPFKLTKDQKIAAWEIFLDLEKDKPMNRLLEGDVGSGKTVVALMAMYLIANFKKQSILMAPTEILAKQHYETISKLLGGEKSVSRLRKKKQITIGLLTRVDRKIDNKNVSKSFLVNKAKKGQIDILIGTHAVIQEDIKLKNLALTVIDEQHRFGVEQRAKLKKININLKNSPHLLSMTATPIPRTLALGLYGDLDISILKEKPIGRKKILTKLVAPYNRDKAYEFIREKINSGRQVFVVCPRIKASEEKCDSNQNMWDDIKAVEEEYEKLSKEIFPEFSIAMMHGKLKKEDKEKTLSKFRNNEIKILVSTSVIEVGIDFPNATIMMIEGAERFGLAQLHQFRGRVGRSEIQSFCFLFSDSMSQKSYDRLMVLVNCDDGFVLAEKDLELRGPGEVYGIRQSGLPDLKMASLMDGNLLKLAKAEAERFLVKNNIKKFPLLREKINIFCQTTHFE